MRSILPSHDEVSSTEKLLDVIRGSQVLPDGTAEDSAGTIASPEIPNEKVHIAPPLQTIHSRKKNSIGVYVGRRTLKLLKLVPGSGRRYRLIDYRSIPLKPEISRGTPAFIEFLRASLAEFGAGPRRAELWSVIPASQVDLRHVLIPKVPKKQIPQAVFWTVKREMHFDEKETIFDFEVQGEETDKGIPKLAVMACIAPRQEVKTLQDLFSKAGFRLTGITVAPFAFQNFFRYRWMAAEDKTIAMLHIGGDSTQIDIFARGQLVLARGIKAGLNSMVSSLMDELNEKWMRDSLVVDEGEPLAMSPLYDKDHPKDVERGRRVLSILDTTLSRDLEESDPDCGLREEEVFSMVLPAVERLVRQVERTFNHYSAGVGDGAVSRLYICGALNTYERIIEYIVGQLGMESELLDPLDPRLPLEGKEILPGSMVERAGYVLPLGLALSDNSRTPNLIHTYKDKEKAATIARTNRSIFVAFMAIIAACLGIFWWQGRVADAKSRVLEQLEQQLSQYIPMVNEDLILQMSTRLKQQQERLREQIKVTTGKAAIAELAALSSPGVRLVAVEADLKGRPGGNGRTEPGKEGNQKVERSITLEGIVMGDREGLEAALARYLIQLESSPLFTSPSVVKNSLEFYEKEGEALHFTLKAGLR